MFDTIFAPPNTSSFFKTDNSIIIGDVIDDIAGNVIGDAIGMHYLAFPIAPLLRIRNIYFPAPPQMAANSMDKGNTIFPI